MLQLILREFDATRKNTEEFGGSNITQARVHYSESSKSAIILIILRAQLYYINIKCAVTLIYQHDLIQP